MEPLLGPVERHLVAVDLEAACRAFHAAVWLFLHLGSASWTYSAVESLLSIYGTPYHSASLFSLFLRRPKLRKTFFSAL